MEIKKNKIIWGVILVIPLFLLFISCKNTDKDTYPFYPEKYKKCDSKITKINIENGNFIKIKDTLFTDYLATIDFRGSSILLDSDSNKLVIVNSYIDSGTVFHCYDTSGNKLYEWKSNIPLTFPQIINDSMILFTTIEYTTRGFLTNLTNGEIIKKFILPFESRFGINYQIVDDYLFTVGFQDIKDEKIKENFAVGCYNKNDLRLLSDICRYPIELSDRIHFIVTRPAQIDVINDTAYGVFAFFPLIFKSGVTDATEEQWLSPIYKKYNYSYFKSVAPEKVSEVKEKLENCQWSVQYYADMVNDSLFMVFREHNPPYYIDLYNIKPEPPVYLGSKKVEDNWQPVSSWKNRIILVDRDLLLKENKILLQFAYVELEK